ncbi:hypothetical protein BAUCODRAFT_163391 [Baudoinia panamericana UAMH 10762]|uniref:Uncharacterized protein n=1 Tax=Baudoinia panamericana (strain UAMH 10762) TaxID=717646 RepID=M2NLN5_BAUPA|nr:uncharacterized protein BAUCODRAFT_163391 [Baudoinia panamericana UAMH 10762]EMD00405.1 hypothetical protein BAUCODRAFT_163391 [Baudoinia panamericana UAMH 10762]
MGRQQPPELLEEYFHSPRDLQKHSKWPYFLRLHGSVLPKMIVPLLFVAAWATAITCISQLVHNISINPVLVTIMGFVVGLALSFRSTTAYERYMEGRKYWAQLLLASRNIARLVWVHVIERHAESAELGKEDLLGKLAALNLLNAFAISLMHRLRFEPSVEYPDLAPLVANLKTLAAEADQAALRVEQVPLWKSLGLYLGMSFAEDNPRALVKYANQNLGNTPLEILNYLSAYVENIVQNKTFAIGALQGQVMNQLHFMGEALAGVERVVNTPLPVAYSIIYAQITWAYVLALPFQLVYQLHWVAIPGTLLGGYIILGLAAIGRELENPFGHDVSDLPLESFCRELASDIDTLTGRPAPLKVEDWMSGAGAKVMWPMSELGYKAWEAKSVDEIRATLKAKAESVDVKRKRTTTMKMSENLTPSV